jgi:hypothetical protein
MLRLFQAQVVPNQPSEQATKKVALRNQHPTIAINNQMTNDTPNYIPYPCKVEQQGFCTFA